MRTTLQDYTESEFEILIRKAFDGDLSDDDVDDLADFFSDVIKHPSGSDLVTHPSMCGIAPTPEAIITELKRWYASQGIPCFKD